MSEAKITLNKKEWQFQKSKMSFLGQTEGKDSIKPDKSKVAAVVNMEAPQNLGELRILLGMVNQLGKFLPSRESVKHPLDGLLSPTTHGCWGQPQDQAFKEVKDLLSSSQVLSLYDWNLPTKSYSRQFLLRVGSSVLSATSRWQLESCCICFIFSSPRRALLHSNRERDFGKKLVLFLISRLLFWLD